MSEKKKKKRKISDAFGWVWVFRHLAGVINSTKVAAYLHPRFRQVQGLKPKEEQNKLLFPIFDFV